MKFWAIRLGSIVAAIAGSYLIGMLAQSADKGAARKLD